MKIVDLQKLWNYVVDNFLIWNHLIMQNYVWISKIWNSNFSNDLEWKNFLNKNCRSRKVTKLCSWPFFDLNSFRTSNKQFTLNLKKQFKKYVIEKKKKKLKKKLNLPSASLLTPGKQGVCRVPVFAHSTNPHSYTPASGRTQPQTRTPTRAAHAHRHTRPRPPPPPLPPAAKTEVACNPTPWANPRIKFVHHLFPSPKLKFLFLCDFRRHF